MARTRTNELTDAQKVTRENDKFRRELYKQHLEEAQAAPINEDIDKFRRDSYRQALRDAKNPQITE